MKRINSIIRIAGVTILLFLIIAGCKTVQKSKSANVPPVNSAMPEESALIYFHGTTQESVNEVVTDAHNQQLKLFEVLDLTDPAIKSMNISVPEIKTLLKHRIRKIAEVADIDGIGIRPGGQSFEIIEHIFAEAMLIKPYLITFIIYDEADYQLALSCLNEGITDMIIPVNDIGSITPGQDLKKIQVPANLKKIKPEQVFALDLYALFNGIPGGHAVQLIKGEKSLITDGEGFINFIAQKSDTMELKTESGTYLVETGNWFTPYRYSVQPDGSVKRKTPWVEFRRMPKELTDAPDCDLLCKTDYPASVSINGVPLKQYKTGIFFNKINLNEGVNRVRADVMTQDSLSVFYEREFIYRKSNKVRQPFPLWIDEKSVEPTADQELLSEDLVRISFRGSLGQEAYIHVVPGKTRVKCSREDHEDYSLYRADLYMSKLAIGKPYKIVLEFIPPKGNTGYRFELPCIFKVRNPEDYPLVRVRNENSRLTYNLGAPRLGGPIRSELGPGVIMKTNGRIGEYYRVHLSSIENGFIHKDDVEVLPSESIRPSYTISSMSCAPSANADVLSIPYPEPVPYEIYPDPDRNRIVITLYGVETSTTWITHMEGRKIIDKVTWQQTTPETYQIFVNLKASNIWGYDLRQDGKRLVLSLRYPPQYDLNGEKPLTGLKIAIEAGHGGSGLGAVGLSGLIEKDINLDLSFMLGELFRNMGADVIQVRDSDKDIPLLEKRDIAKSSGADMLISIHANAGGRGYLSVPGTSTYYHNPLWAPLAEDIYNRLLELDLKEFGMIGSFNYTVTRVSQMPSVLVEQAFMSHAEDEEKLADPQFRQQMAQKIYEGIIDYLKFMKP